MRCLLRAARRACRFCLVEQALYAARALLFSSLASVISSVWESNQSAVLLVFLYWKWRQHCWSFPINHMRYHCAHLEKIPQAHMQIPRLYLVDGICSCQSEASPPFLCDTVTLMAILLCCTPRRDSYRIQHSDNWCLVRIRSNWCRCLDLGCLQETVGACYWRTGSWNRVCDEGIALEGLGYFRSSSQWRNDLSKWAMSFDQHQLWRCSHREWTVSSSFSVIPLMVIASSWYNLSFASPGDDRVGA